MHTAHIYAKHVIALTVCTMYVQIRTAAAAAVVVVVVVIAAFSVTVVVGVAAAAFNICHQIAAESPTTNLATHFYAPRCFGCQLISLYGCFCVA